MAKLLKAIQNYDDDLNPAGLTIRYRVGTDVRGLILSQAEIDGLSVAQIKALAQSRADADAGLPGSDPAAREDVIPNPIKEARQWFKANPAVRAFFEQDTAGIDSDIDGANTAQLKEIIKGCVIVARAYGLLEIAD